MDSQNGNNEPRLLVENPMIRIWLELLTKATLYGGIIGLAMAMAAALLGR